MMRTLLSKSFKKAALLAFFTFASLGTFAQVTTADSVCAGTQDKVYGITTPNANSTFNWYLSDPTAGVIDNSITTTDSIIEIDWGTTTGTYTIYVVENTMDGCLGDTVELDVVINALPTVAFESDSICPDFEATLTFEFTGRAPWIVEYTDGTTTFTDTAAASPFTATLPPYASSQTIDVTALSDRNNCDADAAGLPSEPVHVYPVPGTGAIFHY